MKTLLLGSALILAICASVFYFKHPPAHLTVYTYKSFDSSYGPGPTLKPLFEKECRCQLQFVASEDAGGLLPRLQLEGTNTAADVVLGIDGTMELDASSSGYFVPLPQTLDNPRLWGAGVLTPIDYGFFAFMQDTQALKAPYNSMEELLGASNLDKKIVVSDPRTSLPGLGLLIWLHTLYGPNTKDKLLQLKPKILTIAKGWSDAYGLFTKGEAPIVLSYTTSEAYHREVEKNDRYRAMIFSEGHIRQVEYAGVLRTSKNYDLAIRFIKFIASPTAQEIIAAKNWMYPILGTAATPTSYAKITIPRVLEFSSRDISIDKQRWIDEWSEVFSH